MLKAALDGNTGEIATYVLSKIRAILIGNLEYSGLWYLFPETVLDERLVFIGIDKAAELGAILIFHLNGIAGNMPCIEVPIILTNLLNGGLTDFAVESALTVNFFHLPTVLAIEDELKHLLLLTLEFRILAILLNVGIEDHGLYTGKIFSSPWKGHATGVEIAQNLAFSPTP